MLDDPKLAQELFEDLKASLPERIVKDGISWRLVGLNPRFRFCRYRPGQHFRRHRDGAHHEGAQRRSFFTFMIYLTTSAPAAGGATRFYASRDPAAAVERCERPLAGDAVIFGHDYWHDGEEPRSGLKYVMRSDVMYECELPELSEAHSAEAVAVAVAGAGAEPRHHGYIWRVLARRDGSLATAARDKSIGIWTRPPRGGRDEWRMTQQWRGHRASVYSLLDHSNGTLWSGDRAGELRLWGGVRNGKRRTRGGAVLSFAELVGGDVVCGSADGWIRQWSDDGLPLRAWRAHDGWVWSLARCAGALWSAGEDGTVSAWREADKVACITTGQGSVRALEALPQQRLALGHVSGAIDCWRVGDLGALAVVQRLRGHRGAIRALAALPGERLASASEDDSVRLWCLRSGVCLKVWRHADFATSVAALDGDWLASSSYDGRVRVRRAPAATTVRSALQAVAVAPSGVQPTSQSRPPSAA